MEERDKEREKRGEVEMNMIMWFVEGGPEWLRRYYFWVTCSPHNINIDHDDDSNGCSRSSRRNVWARYAFLIFSLALLTFNTVLRGQLFERSEEDSNILQVRQKLYVIPNALVAEQFKPCGQPSNDTTTTMTATGVTEARDATSELGMFFQYSH